MEEIIGLTAVLGFFATIITWMILHYKFSIKKGNVPTEDRSLTISELDNLIEEKIELALGSMDQRLTSIERGLPEAESTLAEIPDQVR